MQVGPYRIQYIDEGRGEPMLVFIHGSPTCSYLWRNVLPQFTDRHRCIAFDLLGFGGSDRPDIDYTFPQHYTAVRRFLDQIESDDIVLVLHDWGGLLGLTWALEHPASVRGVAFMETFPFQIQWQDYPKAWKVAINILRAPGIGVILNQWLNWQVPLMLKHGVANRSAMTPETLRYYTQQFLTPETRRPVGRFLRMLPIEPTDEGAPVAMRIIKELPEREFPLLLIRGEPGAVITEYIAGQLQTRLPRMEVVSVGPAGHFIPEEQPEAVAQAVAAWLERLAG